MRKSIWRFKRSPFTELLVVGALVAAACQVSSNKEPKTAGRTASVPPVPGTPGVASGTVPANPAPLERPDDGMLDGDWRTTKFAYKLVGVDEKAKTRTTVGEMHAVDCGPEAKGPVHLRFKMTSFFGEHLLRVSLYTTSQKEEIEAEADARTMRLAIGEPMHGLLKARACAAKGLDPNHGGDTPTELELPPPAVAAVRDWLTRIAPDCASLDVTAEGFDCRLPIVDAEAAHQELTGIRTTMIRRWSRQPYLLAHRLAVGVKLAEAIQSTNPARSLATMCRVIKHSLPVELPATLASSRWQTAVCTAGLEPAKRLQAAKFGLAKTVAEIDFLRQLFERTSKLGALTLKVPDTALQSDQVLVSLTPDADVRDNMMRETAKLWGIETAASALEDLPRACWHPVYGESERLLRLARHLSLGGDAGQVECVSTAATADGAKRDTEADAAALARYVADSITSETEFVMPNRRSTTLRLPVGSYSYTLRALPSDPSEWDDASQTETPSTGKIVWGDKKSRPIIQTW